MGLVTQQFKDRRDADQELLSDSLLEVAQVVVGHSSSTRTVDDTAAATRAVAQIMRHYRLKVPNVPESVTDVFGLLDYCLRPHGLMYREVKLDKHWYRESFTPILAFDKKDGSPIALIPGKVFGYWFTDAETGLPIKVGPLNAGRFEEGAISFYRALPQQKLTVHDLVRYLFGCITFGDVLIRGTAAVGVALIGLIMPRLVSILTGPVLATGDTQALFGIAVFMICTAVSQKLVSTSASLLSTRLQAKACLSVEASMMMRLLSLPANFFQDHSPGELKTKFFSVNALCELLMSLATSVSLTSFASLIYVTQIVAFTPRLVIPALITILVTLVFSLVTAVAGANVSERRMEAAAAEASVSYTLISNIRKVRLAGAEKRMYAKWLNSYTRVADLTYNPPLIIKTASVVNLGITLVSNIVLYYLAVKSGVDQSSYFAFVSAYGMVMGAFRTLASRLSQAAGVRPLLAMAEPILEAVPETQAEKHVLTDVEGNVRFDHVTFAYSTATPPVLDDLSLSVRAGEYVAIVGKSGCGKSTLIRLLLGFEQPTRGIVSVDGRDLSKVDLPSLRRHIGTVMQHDGLFQGTIYYNISICAPELTLEGAWEAAEAAGIADDIRAMPMGMHTLISEGQGGISGGQRQRLMIARAIAAKPKLLVFDEATSALDNKAQRQVTAALDAMGCTRIVVAHRLSTIRHCDRILVIDGGSIAEDGTYEELVARDGLFAELVRRQRLDL